MQRIPSLIQFYFLAHTLNSALQSAFVGSNTAICCASAEVWKTDASNLMRVPRYQWFPPTNNDGSPGMGPVGQRAQGTDDDPVSGPLGAISQSLLEAHKRFFQWHDEVVKHANGSEDYSTEQGAAGKDDYGGSWKAVTEARRAAMDYGPSSLEPQLTPPKVGPSICFTCSELPIVVTTYKRVMRCQCVSHALSNDLSAS